MAEKVLTVRDALLIQWLDEAHAKESELITSLTAHIKSTEKMSYKKRLRKHLTETRDHRRKVAARIKKLGGSANLTPTPDPIGAVAGKAVAAVKGQVGAARAALTPQPETHLRNAQEELREEQVEIVLYTRIETLAEQVGDDETAKLARAIRRDEERMAKFLEAELVRLVKEFARAEIPRDQRVTARRSTRRRRTPARTASRATSAA